MTESGGDSQTSDLRFYYDGQVELADYNSDGSLARRFVNGTQYIDERAVLIEGEAGDNGAPVDAETFYYLTQELYTVTGLMKVNGTLTEAGTFDGYGAVRLWHYSDGDFNRDGAVNATDQTRFTAALGVSSGIPAKDPLADLDLDGDVDLTDAGSFTSIKNSGGAMSQLFTSAAGNPFHFTGRRLYMLETLPESDTTPVANQQLQHNRARHYSPMEGRWLQRDPLEYVDTENLLEYVRSSPSRRVDADGAAAAMVACCKYKETGVSVVGGGGTGGASSWTNISYETTDCHLTARSPMQCCKKCTSQTTPFFSGSMTITRQPVRAWWKPCCLCTVTERRGPGIFGWWPFHIILMIDCSDGHKWSFDHPECDITSLPYDKRPTEQQYPTIVSSFVVHCTEAQLLVDEAEKMEAEDPEYGFFQDCHWAIRELLRRWRERFGNDQ